MRKKTRNITLLVVVVVVVVLLTSPRIKLFDGGTGRAAAAAGGDQRLPVTVHVAFPESVDEIIQSTGIVLANEEVLLKAEISGRAERILFQEGRRVAKGDLLLKLNDDELQAQLLRLISQEKLAQEKERRRKLLFEKQNISPEDYENALNELTSVQAEVQLVQARIAKTEIRAPFDGIAGLRYVSEGSSISPDTRIASLQNIVMVKLDFSVPGKYANTVKKDQIVYFTITGMDEKHTARIYAVEPKIDPVTRSVQIRAISPNPEGKITPGAFAKVELVLSREKDALMVPSEAIVPELQGQKVFLLKNGVVASQSVETGVRTERMVQITSGLRTNDTVLTSGLLQVRPGIPVRIAGLHRLNVPDSTILGTLPIALALGSGSESRVSMGIAVIGGLIFSSGLTLFVIPAVYSYFSKEGATVSNAADMLDEGEKPVVVAEELTAK